MLSKKLCRVLFLYIKSFFPCTQLISERGEIVCLIKKCFGFASNKVKKSKIVTLLHPLVSDD